MVLRLNTGKDINSFRLNFNCVLISQFTQVALHLLVNCVEAKQESDLFSCSKFAELLVEIPLLAKASLVHTDLVLFLVKLKLVLVNLPPDLLVTLVSKLFELSLLVIFQVADHFSGLVKLQPQILYQAILVRCESVRVCL